MKITCSKLVSRPCTHPAVEFLLIHSSIDGSGWNARPRCAKHPAAEDIPLLRFVDAGTLCLIAPIPGMVTA